MAKILFFGLYLYLIRLQDPAREKEIWRRISKRVKIECYDRSRWHANTHHGGSNWLQVSHMAMQFI